MKLTAQQYAKTLFESLQDTESKHHGLVMDNFVAALKMNNDLKMFDEIALEFEKLEKAQKGIKIADVTSAKKLDKSSEKAIIEQLNKLVGGKVELKQKIDEKLIGGVVIKLDDMLIDASAKNSLEELKKSITN